MTSDLFIEDADEWRSEAWEMMKERQDVRFFIITKRILRFFECAPDDWGSGYDNVAICCTMENQRQCDIRFPFFNELPCKNKYISCEPLLEDIDIRKYLTSNIINVTAGGESGPASRLCRYEWVLNLRDQCVSNNVGFWFKQTGANFEKDGKIYSVKRKYQHSQASRAGINYSKL